MGYALEQEIIEDCDCPLCKDQSVAANRLVRITEPGSGTNPLKVSQFVYDGKSKMVELKEKQGVTTVADRHFIYDGTRIAEERDQHNNVVKRFYNGGVQVVSSSRMEAESTWSKSLPWATIGLDSHNKPTIEGGCFCCVGWMLTQTGFRFMSNSRAGIIFPLATSSIAALNEAAVNEIMENRQFGVTLREVKKGLAVARLSSKFAVSLATAKSNPLRAIWYSLRINFVYGDNGLHYITTPAATYGYTFEVDEERLILWCCPPGNVS